MSCYRNYEAEEREAEHKKQEYLKEVEKIKVGLEEGKLAEILANLSLYKQQKY